MNYLASGTVAGTEIPSDSATDIIVLEAVPGKPLVVPGGNWLLGAEFVRQGSDLFLVGKDGTQVLVRGFFETAVPPDLVTTDGAVVSGKLAMHLAGPLAPGQYAQAGPTGAAEPIGQVETVSGEVRVTRADGTKEVLAEGDAVFQGDIVETDADSAVGIVLADDTTFSLGESGRMTLDEMVYDPGIQEGSQQPLRFLLDSRVRAKDAGRVQCWITQPL